MNMNKHFLAYSGFSLSWTFYDESHADESMPNQDAVTKHILTDVETVLTILHKHELLFPKYVLIDKKVEVIAESVGDFVSQLRSIIDTQREFLAIDRITGSGFVYLNNTEKLLVEDVVSFEDIRFTERKFDISTTKSLWVPININTHYDFEWQIEIANLNNPRLEYALTEIHQSLPLTVEPAPDEIERSAPIWMKGFKLYLNPEILKREYQQNPPQQPFPINQYLLPE